MSLLDELCLALLYSTSSSLSPGCFCCTNASISSLLALQFSWFGHWRKSFLSKAPNGVLGAWFSKATGELGPNRAHTRYIFLFVYEMKIILVTRPAVAYWSQVRPSCCWTRVSKTRVRLDLSAQVHKVHTNTRIRYALILIKMVILIALQLLGIVLLYI